jgi:hypothetical protein
MEWILAIIFLAFAAGFASAIAGLELLVRIGPAEDAPE